VGQGQVGRVLGGYSLSRDFGDYPGTF